MCRALLVLRMVSKAVPEVVVDWLQSWKDFSLSEDNFVVNRVVVDNPTVAFLAGYAKERELA